MKRVYDNGDEILGSVKSIREYIEKYGSNGLDLDDSNYLLEELKEYKDDQIIVINYSFGMGVAITDCWTKEDIVLGDNEKEF